MSQIMTVRNAVSISRPTPHQAGVHPLSHTTRAALGPQDTIATRSMRHKVAASQVRRMPDQPHPTTKGTWTKAVEAIDTDKVSAKCLGNSKKK